MASISVSGTGFAALTSVLALLIAPVVATAEPGGKGGEVDVRFQGLRSAKGMIRACLTQDRKFFPYCDKDPAAAKISIPAGGDAAMRFTNLAAGDYALVVLHDENQNHKADMMLGIPREGVGFSRNPRLVMSAPGFDAVRFHVAGGVIAQTVQLKYFL